MESHKNNGNNSRGFTVIEIIAILLVIAIIGVIAVSRATSTKNYNVASETEILKANIRYAQFRAMSDADITYDVNNVTWGILLSGSSYTLQKNGANATTYFPGESSPTHSLPSGISITTGAGTTITYNLLGIPVDTSIPGIPITSNVTITITDGASPQTITVTQNTGLIP